MDFYHFIHEITDVNLTLNKDNVYVDSTIHVGRFKGTEIIDDIKRFKMDIWSYDWNLEKDFKKMKLKFNWRTIDDKYSIHYYIDSYRDDNGARHIKFETYMNLSDEEYDCDLKMIKEMIEYLNNERLTKWN